MSDLAKQHKQHKHRRGRAYEKIKKRVFEGPPCWPKDLYNDPELGLSTSTVTHGLRRGLETGDFYQLEDGSYVPMDYKDSSEVATLWQPQPGEIKQLIKGLKAKDNPELYKASLSLLKKILNKRYWDDELEVFFTNALDKPKAHEEEIDRLLRADPSKCEKLYLFFNSEKDKIYDLVKTSDRLASPALIIFIDVSNRKDALDKIEKTLKGEEAEKVLKAAQGYERTIYEKLNHGFVELLYKAAEHENKIVRDYASTQLIHIQNFYD